MKITISGSSGYLGKGLINFLEKKNFVINRLSRNNGEKNYWEPEKNLIPQSLIENSDIVINLNGEKIIKPFSRMRIAEIKTSRLNPTKTLISAISKSKHPPRLIISASACGFYGDRPNEIIDENSPKGRGNISDIVHEWESVQVLKKTRIVFLRFGNIIDKNSDIYKYMKKYSSIIGLKSIGSGKNYFPWISKIDALRSINHVINHENIKGPVNVVSIKPITFKEVIKSINLDLEPILKFSFPELTVPILFGKLGKEVLLNDQKVLPTKLTESGFNWMKTTPIGSLT